MPQLQTIVNIPPPDFSIDYSNKILMLGSCFSTNIGCRLESLKFQTNTNPFGVIYNPASIAQSLNILLEKECFTLNELNYNNGLWYSYYHHSAFSNTEKEICLDGINKSLHKAKLHLSETDIVFLTLGTAWAFRNKQTGQIVANCHKVPASEFDRVYLNPSEVTETLSTVIKNLLKLNTQIKVIFTVSPIRHWKDGAIENMRSKSTLLLSIKEIEEEFQNIYYFPVYEVFMDEMRDYRFYASDMLHPSDFSIDYVWEKFTNTFFESNTRELVNEVGKLLKSFAHRPVNAKGDAYGKFIEQLKKRVYDIQKRNSFLDFSEELAETNKNIV